MRRNNYPYQPLTQTSTDSSRVAVSQDALEEENERSAEELKQKIGALKSLTIDIGHEVRYQDKLLRGIDDDMDRTHGFLSNTMGRVVRLEEKIPGANPGEDLAKKFQKSKEINTKLLMNSLRKEKAVDLAQRNITEVKVPLASAIDVNALNTYTQNQKFSKILFNN
uniref:BET1 homolog n=1 Tax=Glossina austeni TaxID=7395 RepID=A0A1A9V3U8_GLOAU